MEKLGEKAREFLNFMGDPQVKRVTYELMNDVRDSSMSEVFGVKPNELVKVMRQAPRATVQARR